MPCKPARAGGLRQVRQLAASGSGGCGAAPGLTVHRGSVVSVLKLPNQAECPVECHILRRVRLPLPAAAHLPHLFYYEHCK
jgi:hypothetical protein